MRQNEIWKNMEYATINNELRFHLQKLILTRRERLKSALYLRLRKRKVFKLRQGHFLWKSYKNVSKHPKGVFCARKTLQ